MSRPSVLVFCPTFSLNGIKQIAKETQEAINALRFDGKMRKIISDDNPYDPPDYRNLLYQYQKARRLVLTKGFDALLTIEHDIIPPADGLQKLWDMNVPVAYGIYLFRGSKNIVNVYRLVNSKNPDMSLSLFKPLLDKAIKDKIVEVSGCGNGFTLIRREVLEAFDFRANGDNPIPDMSFAADCLQHGFKQYGNFDVQCGHLINENKIYFQHNGERGNVAKIEVLKDFVARNGKSYKVGQEATMSLDLIDDYERGGYIKVYSFINGERPWVKKIPINHAEQLVVSFKAFQKKSQPLMEALKDHGHRIVGHRSIGDCLLIDHDMVEYGYRELVEAYWRRGKPAYLYPHGAAPILSWDGMRDECEMVAGNFVTSRGHAAVMKRYGYKTPTHVIGWYLCPIQPWKPTDGYRILFAPIHPVKGHKYMYAEDTAINARTYARLLELDNVKLTIRHIGELRLNGIWEAPGVRILQGMTDNNFEDIDAADLVIANGTFAYLAIARGKPTIMLNQDTCARDLVFDQIVRAKRYDEYKDYMRFPYDVDDREDLTETIEMALTKEPKLWKKRFIGEQFDGQEFCKLLERLVRDYGG